MLVPVTPSPLPAASAPENYLMSASASSIIGSKVHQLVATLPSPPPTPSIDMVFNEGHRIAIVVYSLLMVISTVGNITVLITIIRRSNGKRLNRVNLMLFHLAIADLFVTFLVMPLEIGWAYTVSWEGGDFLCRLFAFFRIFGLFLSGFVLICISVDRLFAVTRPLHSVCTADDRGRRMLAVAWLMSAICSAPQSAIFHVERHPDFQYFTQCVTFNWFPSRGLEVAYSVFGNVAMYIVPLIVISFCYSSIFLELCKKSGEQQTENHMRRSSSGNLCRAKTRTLQMTFVTVIVFFVCWTPYNVMSFWYWFDNDSAQQVDQRIQKVFFLFACTNSSVNPMVYGFFNFSRQKKNSLRNKRTPIEKVVPPTVGRNSSGSISSVCVPRGRLGTCTTISSNMSLPTVAETDNMAVANKTLNN